MTDSEKQDFAIEVLVALHTEKQDRLTQGMIRRQAMHDQIKRGETPVGYRPDWIKSQARELVRALATAAEEFDLAHPDDKASVSDLMDILATTIGMFKKSVHD